MKNRAFPLVYGTICRIEKCSKQVLFEFSDNEAERFYPFQDFQGPGIHFCQFRDFPGFQRPWESCIDFGPSFTSISVSHGDRKPSLSSPHLLYDPVSAQPNPSPLNGIFDTDLMQI